MQPPTRDGLRERYGGWERESELENDDGDPRRSGTVAANATVDVRRVLGARVGEGGRRGVRSAGGAGSLVFFVNVDDFPIPFPTVAS